MASTSEHILEQLRERLGADSDLQLPPNVFLEMESELLSYDEGVALRVRIPVRERYANPMGFMQGGMIAAAIDNALGPLSFLVAPPSVTTQLNTSFVRPVTPRDEFIEVEARVVQRAGQQLFLSAEVTNPAGKCVALAHATCMIRR